MYCFEKATFFATEAVTDFCRTRLGHRLGLLTAPRQSYKLTPSQRPPLAVGSLTSSDIIFGHSVDFKKRSYGEEHPSEKSIQIGDSKQQDEEVAAEPVFA